jgi:hypothetical protein
MDLEKECQQKQVDALSTGGGLKAEKNLLSKKMVI